MGLHLPIISSLGIISLFLNLIFIPCAKGEALESETESETAETLDQVIIFHTNDIHGHVSSWIGWDKELKDKQIGGLDRLATILKDARRMHGRNSVLVFDAGDAIGDTLIAANSKGHAIFTLLDKLLYDAIAPGNHEYDFTVGLLKEYDNEFNLRLLAANLHLPDNSKPLFEPYHVFSVKGYDIAVIGLTYPKTSLTTARKNIEGVEFLPDSRSLIEAYLVELKEKKVDYVILLSHLGLNGDIALAKKLTGVDLIIGGHSHNRIKEVMLINDIRIVQAGAHGSDVGRVKLKFIKDGSVEFNYELITLDETVPSDPETASLIGSLSDRYAAEGEQAITTLSEPLIRAQTIAGQEPEKRDGQSPIDSFFADIIRNELGSDVVFLPGVGYGVALPRGALTKAALKNMIPHDSTLYEMKLTGTEIREVLEQAIENVFTSDPQNKVGGMIQVSGISFSYDPNRPKGQRVGQVKVANTPLDPDQLYKVVTNGLLAQGGHNYSAFQSGVEKKEASLKQYDLIERYLIENGSVAFREDQRILKE